MAAPEIETHKREIRTSLEKLDPPTAVAGRFAELARVNRYIKIDLKTLEETEYSPLTVDILWDKKAADTLLSLERQKADIASKAVEEIKTINADIETLKDVAAVADALVVP